jgi:hypothetical protein
MPKMKNTISKANAKKAAISSEPGFFTTMTLEIKRRVKSTTVGAMKVMYNILTAEGLMYIMVYCMLYVHCRYIQLG